MRLPILIFLLSGSLCAQQSAKLHTRSLIAESREQGLRAARYHQLVRKLKAVQAEQKAFTDEWNKDCAAKGQVLMMQPDGDPTCSAPPPAASPVPVSPAAPPAEKHKTEPAK